MAFDNKIIEIGEEININEIETNLVDNVGPKLDEFGEPSRRKTYFMRPRYIPGRRTTNFSFEFILRKITTFEKIGLTPISQT